MIPRAFGKSPTFLKKSMEVEGGRRRAEPEGGGVIVMDEGQRASELTKFAGDARGVGAWGPSDLSLTFGPKSGSGIRRRSTELAPSMRSCCITHFAS